MMKNASATKKGAEYAGTEYAGTEKYPNAAARGARATTAAGGYDE
jgi:hypothetical protein